MARQIRVTMLVVSLVLLGCKELPPSLLPIGNREVQVGSMVEIVVTAKPAQGGSVQLKAENMPSGASFLQFAPTQARFTWSPTAADIGDVYVDFFVSQNSLSDSERVLITVRGETADGPVFVGQSTWILDSDQKSINRLIEVRDPTARSIDWTIENAPSGSAFRPSFRQAEFSWQPSEEQRKQPRYSFTVTVINDRAESSLRVFTILVRNESEVDNCPDEKPFVDTMTPMLVEGINDFEVTAVAFDTLGVITSVNMRWSEKDEALLSDYQSVPMVESDTDVYHANVRLLNDLEPGEHVSITYIICARSNQGNDCEQEACTPRVTMTARRPGGSPLCAPCEEDIECGFSDSRCLPGADSSERFCGSDCSGTGFCPGDYFCQEFDPGIKQCVPNAGTCQVSVYAPAMPGEIVINEILPLPPEHVDVNGDGIASVFGDQFVELVSVASDSVDIGGYTIGDRSRTKYTFPIGTLVHPGEAVVVFGGGNPLYFTEDFGGAQLFSVLPDNPEGQGLDLVATGDDVILRSPEHELIAAVVYGDLSSVPAESRYSLTLEPEVTGIVMVPHSAAADGRMFSPGLQLCGNPFPMNVHGACQGIVFPCGDRVPNFDYEPNNARHEASCIDGREVSFRGRLEYHGIDRDTHPGPNPMDYYIFKAHQGDLLSVVTDLCDNENSVVDTHLEILDATGRLLMENDDLDGSSPLLFAEIHDYEIPATGTYYLVVRTYQGNVDDSGCYELWMKLILGI